MDTRSKVTAVSLIKRRHPSIAAKIAIIRPHFKQFTVVSKNSTVTKKKYGSPNVYTVKIETDTPQITPTSRVRVYCNCFAFQYYFAYCFHQKGALILEPGFLLEPPVKTNPGCKKFEACKHIQTALRFALERKL